MHTVEIRCDRSIHVVETAIPMPSDEEVLIRPTAYEICGTDLHVLHHGFPGSHCPCTPVHELARHAVALGPGTGRLREGDLVAVHANAVCETCR